MEQEQLIQDTQAPTGGDPLERLWKGLSDDGRYTKSFDEFKVKYSTKENIDNLYNGLVEDGDYTKTNDEFYSQYFPSVTSKKKDGSAVSQTGSELSQPDLIKLSKERAETIGQIDVRNKIATQNKQFGTMVTDDGTTNFKNRLQEINTQLQAAGYDEGTADDIAKLPIGEGFNYDLKSIIPLKKTNPEQYKRTLATIGWRGELFNRTRDSQGLEAALSQEKMFEQGQKATDYLGQRAATKEATNLAAGDKGIMRKIQEDKFYGYAVNLPGRKEAIDADPRYIGNGGNLNNYQVSAMHMLEDTDPETAAVYNRLLNAGGVGDQLDDVKIGYDIKARELERIGRGMMERAWLEMYRNNPNDTELLAQRNLLLQEAETESSRYSSAAQMDAQRVMQEALGARNSIGKRFFLQVGADVADANNWIADLLLSPFMSEKEKAISDLELLGDKEFTQSALTYAPENEQLFGSDFVARFDPELQQKIDAVKQNGALDPDQKANEVSALVQEHASQVNFIPNDRAGKANFTAKALTSNVANVGAQLASQIGLAYITGGSGNASKLKQLSTLFGSTFATTYDDHYADALRNNIANPSAYATTHTAIEAASELISNDFAMVKRAVGGGTLGSIFGKVTQETWDAAQRKGFFRALVNTGKAAATNALQETKEEVVGAAAGNVVDKYAFDQDVDFTDGLGQTAVTIMAAMVPLGMLGLPFQYNEVGRNRKYAMYEIGSNPEKYLQSIETDLQAGAINQAVADQRKQIIEKASAAVQSSVTVKTDGTPLTDNEKTEYAFNQGVLQTIKENEKNVPPAVQEQLQAKREEIEQKQAEIIMPKGEEIPVVKESENEKEPAAVKQSSVPFEQYRDRVMEDVLTVDDSTFDFAITIPSMSGRDKQKAIRDIRSGKESVPAKRLIEALQEMYDSGVVTLNRGRGNNAETISIPIEEYFAGSENLAELSDEEIVELNTILGEDAFNEASDNALIFDDGSEEISGTTQPDATGETEGDSPEAKPAQAQEPTGKQQETAPTSEGAEAVVITDEERTAATGSWPSYKTKFPEATREDYYANRAAGYLKNQKLPKEERFKTEQDLGDANELNAPTGAMPQRIPVAPITGKSPKQLSKIVFDVTKGMKQRAFYVRSGRRRALGSYTPGNSAVKIRYTNDLDTTAHELGHSLDDNFGLLSHLQNQSQPGIEAELMQFASNGGSQPPSKATAAQKRTYKLAEGLAEFVRGLVVNPAATRAAAPELSALYDAKVDDDYKKAIEQFSEDVRTFAGARGIDQVLANVEWDPKAKEGWLYKLFKKTDANNEFVVSFADRMRANMLNPFRAFDKAVNYLRDIQGIDKLLPADDPEVLSRALLHVGAKVDSIISDGMIDANLNRLQDAEGNVKNIDWLIEPLDRTDEKSLEREMEETAAYMIAERTLELADRFGRQNILSGIGGGLVNDKSVAEKALQEFNNYPIEKQGRIIEAARRYREISDDVMKYMVEKGRMSVGAYMEIKENNLHYVGMQRIKEAEPNKEIIPFNNPNGGGAMGSSKEVIKKIEGGTETIGNVYVNLLDTLNKAVREADRNEVMRTFRDLLVSDRSMYEGEPVRFADIGVKVQSGEPNTVTVFVDGKPEHWKFQEDIFMALKGIGFATKQLPRILTSLPKLLRWTVTNSPIFAARNIVRDTQDRMIKSNENGWKNAMGIADFVGDSEHWKQVALAGGLNAGYYMKDRVAFNGLMGEAIRRLAKDKKNIILDPVKLAKISWDGYTNLLSKGETLNRVAEYRAAFKKAKKQGMDDYNAMLYAGNKSAALLDFAMMGHWMKNVNQLIPFSNAAVQGLRASIIRAKENPAAFAARMFVVTVIPQLALWLLSHGDDDDKNEYESLPDYQRDMFWNYKVGVNNWVSVPKPYELAIISSGVDRMLSYQDGNKAALDGYSGSLAKSLLPVDESAAAGPFKALIENYANWDFFREKHIVPPKEENLHLDLRKSDRASRLSHWINSALGIQGWEKDPRYIDHFVKATASYYGNYAVKASNIGREDGEHFSKVDWGFFKESPGYNSKPVQQLMDVIAQYDLNRTNEAKDFRDLLTASFNAKTDEEKEQASKTLRDYATMVLDEMRLKGLQKLPAKEE